jgi:hypothetical protein
MLRKLGGLVVVLCLAGLVSAQTKDKDKDKPKKDVPKVKATLVKVDVDKKTLVVKMDGKENTLTVGKEVKFFGPQGGKATIKDKRLQAGAELGLVMDGKTLKEVHLPYRKAKDKDKDKAKKDKDKDKDKDK